MVKDELKEIKSSISSLKRIIKKEQMYNRELQKFHAFEASTIAFLVAIAVSGFTYLIAPKNFSNISDIIFFTVMILATPASFFLLLFHAYSVYGFFKGKKKMVPFILDFILLFYIFVGLPTVFGITYLYDYLRIDTKFLSTGWFFVVLILLIIIAMGFIISSKYIEKKLIEKFPHTFSNN